MADSQEAASTVAIIRGKRRNPVVDLVIRMYKTKPLGFISLIVIFLFFFTTYHQLFHKCGVAVGTCRLKETRVMRQEEFKTF